ncbi:lipocalin family protein [Flavobacterium sp. LB1P62]|uniref:lipocalin family protein n=1 Tax=unclassified Flavobacterium TaxID=196869 RepID=UPI003AB0A1B5
MTRLIIIFIFFIWSMAINAQSSELLNGKWIFKKALNKEVDDLGRQTLKSDIINKMTFEFKNSGEFVAFAFGQNMIGKWTLSKNSKMITLNTGKDKLDFSVLKLTESELILKLGLGEFLMKKI